MSVKNHYFSFSLQPVIEYYINLQLLGLLLVDAHRFPEWSSMENRKCLTTTTRLLKVGMTLPIFRHLVNVQLKKIIHLMDIHIDTYVKREYNNLFKSKKPTRLVMDDADVVYQLESFHQESSMINRKYIGKDSSSKYIALESDSKEVFI